MTNTRVRQPLDAEQRRAAVEGVARITDKIKPWRLEELITKDRSLLNDYLWSIERMAVERFVAQNAEVVRRVTLADLLGILEEGRPDLHQVVTRNGGHAWLQRQWQELRAIIDG